MQLLVQRSVNSARIVSTGLNLNNLKKEHSRVLLTNYMITF